MDLQQCADSVMRLYAEYYWQGGQHEKIKFRFTNGFLCEYTKWKEGHRVKVSGNDVTWEKTSGYDDSYETFVAYMHMVFNYAGTKSMETYEADYVAVANMEAGERAYLLAQGYMPAQQFHVLNNPMHEEDPWYYADEMSFPLNTAEYLFSEDAMACRLRY